MSCRSDYALEPGWARKTRHQQRDSTEGNRYLIVHEGLGFGSGDNLQAIRDFISYRTDPGRANDERLHAIW
jgi:hypothetical protein